MKSITRYSSFDHIRGLNQHSGDEFNDAHHQPDHLRPDHHLEIAQYLKQVGLSLESIDKTTKEAILLTYISGYKGNEVSHRLNTSINTIKSKLRRGLVFARQSLAQKDVYHPDYETLFHNRLD